MKSPQEFPSIIPVFPLAGSILLPAGVLSLHIFEDRYQQMISDVLAGNKYIGIIQPKDRFQDFEPPVYVVGGLGEIVDSKKLEDGLYMIVLRGVTRFKVVRELPKEGKLYRQMVVDYEPFIQDQEVAPFTFDLDRLFRVLEKYVQPNKAKVNFTQMRELPTSILITELCQALQCPVPEKQTLLEAKNPEARAGQLLAILEIGMVQGEVH